MLLRSQGRCLLCNDLIASVHVHDFKTCSCGAFSLDGGRDYARVLGNAGDWELCPVKIREDLPLITAGHVLMVLKTLERIAPHNKPDAWRPTVAVNNLLGFTLWKNRGSVPGEFFRNEPSRVMTGRYLRLLQDNGLVACRKSRTLLWRSQTALAPPLDY